MNRHGIVLRAAGAAVAAAAERAGFGSVWAVDSFTRLGALAAWTSSARLGALVTDIATRNPAVVAKQATAIDVISHGRAVLAIGGADAGRVEEALAVLAAMFRDAEPTFAGRYHRIERAFNRPAPVQPGGPPVLVVGHPAVAARHAAGAVLTCGPDGLRAELAALARCCGESGRDPATLRTMWVPAASVTPDAVGAATTVPGLDDVIVDIGPTGAPDRVTAWQRALRADQ